MGDRIERCLRRRTDRNWWLISCRHGERRQNWHESALSFGHRMRTQTGQSEGTVAEESSQKHAASKWP